MNHWPSPLLCLIIAPLLGIFLILLRGPARFISLAVGVFGVFCSLSLVFSYQDLGRVEFQEWLPWLSLPGVGQISLHFGVDGINLPLILLTALVSCAAILVVQPSLERERAFYICILLIITGAFGTFASMDLFFLYVFHELALIPTFLMIGIWGNGQRRLSATYQMAIYLLIGSLVLLMGILALIYSLPEGTRTTNLMLLKPMLANQPLSVESQKLVYPLMLAGFGILVGLFPFHTWAPRGYSAAPSSVAMLHAGVLKKFGIYGLLRVAQPFLPDGAQVWNKVFLALILCNLLVIGWVALSQKNLDDLIGYSSVMHMGYLFLGLAAFTNKSLTGVVILMVGHGLSVAGLFAINGIIATRTGNVTISQLGGLAQKLPFLGFAMTLFGMASLGLPGLANFPGELLIFFGSWEKHPFTTGAALFGVVLSSIYLLRAIKGVFLGTVGSYELKTTTLSGAEKLGVLLLITSLLTLGFLPRLISEAASASVLAWLGAVLP